MKKILLFITLISYTITQSQIVNIPDANFKQALVDHSPIIDSNGDGEIQVSEANSYTGWIEAFNRNISDLTGIESFTNIYALLCENNNLTVLDLSNNLLLEGVRCYNNQLNNIIGIENLNLYALDFSDNNITNIDLTNSNLQRLRCSNNPIIDIDLSQSTNLEILEICNCNQLSHLNIKNGNNINLSGDNCPFENLNLFNIELICLDDINSNTAADFAIGTGASITESCTLSITENELLDFLIFPVPTENILNLKSKKEITKIEIYNKLGQLIIKNTIENKIDISTLTQGLYFVKAEDVNGNFGVKKIVKK